MKFNTHVHTSTYSNIIFFAKNIHFATTGNIVKMCYLKEYKRFTGKKKTRVSNYSDDLQTKTKTMWR